MDFFAVALAGLCFFLVFGARKRLIDAETRILMLERQIKQLAGLAPLSSTESPAPAEAAPLPGAAPEPVVPPVGQAARVVEPDVVRETPAPVEAPAPGRNYGPKPAGSAPAKPSPPTADAAQPAAPKRSFEETIGTKWAVWVGGLALALGALLLVRYAIDQGYFGPGMRVIMGLLLAAGLISGGEYLRRTEKDSSAPTQTPAILTAAGTVAAFGAVYAAHALYGFIGPAFAFIGLGAIGILAMVAAALHGPALAGLGLVGALATPLLVKANSSNPWPVVIFILVVVASAYGLARLRNWLGLAQSGLVGALVWGLLFVSQITFSMPDYYYAALVHGVLHLALACGLFAYDRFGLTSDTEIQPIGFVPPLAVAGLSFLTLQAGAHAGFGAASLVAGALVPVALLTLTGFFVTAAAPLMAAGGLLAAFALLIWPGTGDVLAQTFSFIAFDTPKNRGLFALVAVVGAALVSGASTLRLLTGTGLRLVPSLIYAASAALTPLLLLVLTYLRNGSAGPDMPLAAIAGFVAAAFVLVAKLFRDRGADGNPVLKLALGVFASAALAALALGLVFALDHGFLTVALALAALGAAFVESRLNIPALRWAVAGLGLVVAARFAWEPRIVGAALGTTPIFNWLLWGYGVPALAFGLAAKLMRREGGEDTPQRVAQALAILCAALLVFFEIRHFMNGGDPFARTSGLIEFGLFATSAFGFAIVLTKLDAGRLSPVFTFASLGSGAVSFVLVLAGLGLLVNPLFERGIIPGGGLILGYLLPAVMALGLAYVSKGIRPEWYRNGALVSAFCAAFGFVNLMLRQSFHGGSAWMGETTTQTEWIAYSALWLVIGIALLAIGMARKSQGARLASAVFVVLTVLKVFLFDLSGLEGILRALSFIGLGGVLIGIGLVYQKLIFAHHDINKDAAESEPKT